MVNCLEHLWQFYWISCIFINQYNLYFPWPNTANSIVRQLTQLFPHLFIHAITDWLLHINSIGSQWGPLLLILWIQYWVHIQHLNQWYLCFCYWLEHNSFIQLQISTIGGLSGNFIKISQTITYIQWLEQISALLSWHGSNPVIFLSYSQQQIDLVRF